jgi:transcriptional regulator NrdR family protein
LYDRDQQEANRRVEEQRSKLLKTWAEKLEKAKPNLADFDEIVNSTSVVVSDEVRDAIIESDVGPEILYHLAGLDGEDAQKFQSMPVAKALREIGKLEARFEKQEAAEETAVRSKPVVQKSKAPAPLSPIKATGSAMDTPIGSDGEFHGSFQAWKAARKAGKIR